MKLIELNYEAVWNEKDGGLYSDTIAQYCDVVGDWMEHTPVVEFNHPEYLYITNLNGRFLYHAMFILRNVEDVEELWDDSVFDELLAWYLKEVDELKERLNA